MERRAFISKDNIAGRVFSLKKIKWRLFNMRYEESQIAKGVLFISSMKSQKNIELLIIQMKVKCAKHNIFVEDVAVEHNLTGDL